MSRCFPYPPPGFEKSLASIEPIKIQKESEKAEREPKKEKKREKKEKKEKSRGDKERAEAEKHGQKKRRYSELSDSAHKKTADHPAKAREDDSEQLEKSSLTEEQGGPAAVQSLCDSFDSTQNSSKRSKHESPAVVRITQGGNGLRIRLPLSRHRDTESPLSGEHPCFSGRSDTVPPPPRQEAKAVVRLGQPSSVGDEQPCFSGRTSAAPSGEPHESADRSKPASVGPPTPSGASQHQKSVIATDSRRAHRSHRSGGDRETRRLYKKLILEWSPPPLQAENPEDDDQDWLFGGRTGRRRQQGEGEATAAGAEDAGLGGALCSWPPRACLLPEVGMYALPYVVPF